MQKIVVVILASVIIETSGRHRDGMGIHWTPLLSHPIADPCLKRCVNLIAILSFRFGAAGRGGAGGAADRVRAEIHLCLRQRSGGALPLLRARGGFHVGSWTRRYPKLQKTSEKYDQL